MATIQDDRPLDLSISRLGPSLVSRITWLAAEQVRGAVPEIEAILDQTMDPETLSYGLTVLSTFGYSHQTLLNKLARYNTRVQDAATRHPDLRLGIDPPVIRNVRLASRGHLDGEPVFVLYRAEPGSLVDFYIDGTMPC